MTPSFSVVVISYNGKDLLRQALRHVAESIARPEKVIVVDDCSSDGTADMVRAEFPSCTVIRNTENRGPTYSRNRGAEVAEGEYLVFLDNDILVRPDSIGKLLDSLAAHQKVGLTGGKLISERGRTIVWNMGYWTNPIRDFLGWCLGFFIRYSLITARRFEKFAMHFSLNYWSYDRTIPVGWVIESFNAIRRDLFEELGGFDEGFFMFFEGPDLSRRLQYKGYKTYFVHDAVVNMLEGHTHTLIKRRALFRASLRRFYRKHYWPFTLFGLNHGVKNI